MAESLEQLYQQVILDHSRQRHGAGDLETFDGESFQVNPTCGDEVTLKVSLESGAEGVRIASLGWEGQGCSISQASLSVLHDLVDGRSVEEVEELDALFRELMHGRGQPLDDEKLERLDDASAFVGVAKYPARIKCALLGWMALRDALVQARS